MADTSTTPTSISDDTRADLIALLRAAYPHPDFPDGPYERTADAVIEQVAESTWHTISLKAGLDSLDAKAGGDFASLDAEAAEKVLREIADAEFFKFVRGVATVSLYDDHETWRLLGYEGSSYEHGGYVDRGFADLDWLPEPRIEEYDGPERLVEVADHDQPTGRDA